MITSHVNIHNLVSTLISKIKAGESQGKSDSCTLFCTHWLEVQPLILDVFLQFGIVNIPRLQLDLTQNSFRAFFLRVCNQWCVYTIVLYCYECKLICDTYCMVVAYVRRLIHKVKF